MSQIYVSIACLDIDQELIKTIRSAKDNAKSPNNIHISVAFIGNEDFYSHIKNITADYSNMILNFYPFDSEYGVGMARRLAASKHTNQKYFLQVDAHTFFLQNWDSILIKKIKKAKKITKNDKVVISGLPGAYMYYNKEEKEIFNYYQETSYPQYSKDDFLISRSDHAPIIINEKNYFKFIPKFKDMHYDFISEQLGKEVYKKIKKKGFAPLHKISAAFMFTDSFKNGNTFVDEKSYFWEEEIIQSINLIENNFSLVYSDSAPLTHFYRQYSFKGEGKRTTLIEMLNNEYDFYYDKVLFNWVGFINDINNLEKIKRYEEYANVDLINSSKSDWFLPKKYNH
jgi:hypothetical protein